MHVKVVSVNTELDASSPNTPSPELRDAGGSQETIATWHGQEAGPGKPELEAEVEIYRNILQRVVDVASEAANGNLEVRLLHRDDADKSAAVSHAVNHLLDMTDAFLREAGATLEYAGEGKFFRRVLLRGMRGTFRHKSQLINEATAKMARNAASLKKVENLVSESANLSQDAVREAGEAMTVVKNLGDASERIGGAVKAISQIAWQTKLLALNARIEASRANEAGRGFEVVAREVKELAAQTATATDGIAKEIGAVREEVARTARAIDTMSKTITQMQEISATIERAVAEQKNKIGKR
jgi:methyl-accepting chemotaxis protein